MSDPGRTLVLGAGPTGLGAAHRFRERGFDDFLVVEAGGGPGGLASSFVDAQGFTWDRGGHVQFSHYAHYDDVLDEVMGGAWIEHEREAWVWIRGRFVPYPFQNNLHYLDPAEAEEALAGLEAAARAPASIPPPHLREWLLRTFGAWISEAFLFPYNLKVWGYPLEQLGVGWIGERVAVPDVERLRRNLREGKDDLSWGPNRVFRFPLRGGTGAIWTAVAGRLPGGCQRFGARAVSVDLALKIVVLDSGERLRYDTLVTTLPLDRLCAMSRGLEPEAHDAAASLVHSSCHVLGVGLRGDQPPSLRTKCWMYFPDPAVPYYRVTVFSNYSPFNVPAGEGFWSLMAEVCDTRARPVDEGRLPAAVLSALRSDGLIGARSEVVSVFHHREEHGYPTPSLNRDAALGVLLPRLERDRVYSRGRFGAWKYEVSNQDHSFMQGVELVDRLLGLGEEHTLWRPHHANSGVFARKAPP